MTEEIINTDVAESVENDRHDATGFGNVASEPPPIQQPEPQQKTQRKSAGVMAEKAELFARLLAQDEAIESLKAQLEENKKTTEQKQVGLGQAQHYHTPNIAMQSVTKDGTITTAAALKCYARAVSQLIRQQGGFR